MNEPIKRHYFETTGFSMWPFLRQKDRIIVEDVPASELSPGEVILYRSGAQSICHRLVKKEIFSREYILFTRGDYVPSWKTDKVLEEQVLGRVSGIVRSGKLISLRGPADAVCGMCIITCFPLIVFIFSNILKFFRRR